MNEYAAKRRVLRIAGESAGDFLQSLITNDVGRCHKGRDGLIYAALLSPQGKLVADFFMFCRDGAYFLDTHAQAAAELEQRLNLYRLRAKVEMGACNQVVSRGVSSPPPDAFNDPRHLTMGWRHYGKVAAPTHEYTDFDALRVASSIAEFASEFAQGDYILEAGFERMNGVDFAKGCYVGQEVTARMKHKTELRKGFAKVNIEGAALPGEAILAEGKPVGRLCTRHGNRALAYLRFDRLERAGGTAFAGQAQVRLA